MPTVSPRYNDQKTLQIGWSVKVRLVGYDPQYKTVTFEDLTAQECRGRDLPAQIELLKLKAYSWGKDTEDRLRAGKFREHRGLREWTVRQLCAEYARLNYYEGSSLRGWSEELYMLNKMTTDEFFDLRLDQLNRTRAGQVKHHIAFSERLSQGIEPSSVVRRLSILKQVFKMANERLGFNIDNPFSSANCPRPEGADKERDRVLGLSDDAYCADALARGEDPPRDEETRIRDDLLVRVETWPGDVVMFDLGLLTAMRLSELYYLEWRDIDLENQIVEVWGKKRRGTKTARHQKNHGPEKRVLPYNAQQYLIQLKAKMNPDREDRVVQMSGAARNYSARWAERMKKLKIDDLHFHDMRHTACTRLAKKYKFEDLRLVTGHKKIEMLLRYYNPSLTDVAQSEKRN